ncbi:biotin--[acetyl-CoA-carboxylase] ligase [Candidatus Pelagibacter sp.]|nr:biotin--[acetyl-CoA-carboxylase] ligase [Candidatus Pelagibacter sp.]MDA9594786.1 biotin--[acetyl-CoA-carboxylase] ligase [Candidatus Pelagibacter sp.]
MKIKKFNFKKVNSTNKTAIKIIKNSKLNYGMVVSENQKNGKGQYSKKWISYKGNLFVSFFYNIDNINFSIKKFTRLNCLLVKKLISKFCKKKIFFKSPNDLLINKKKISGILQETIIIDNKKYLIVGIGINIIKSPNITKYPTTNLLEIIGKKIDYKIMVNLLKLIFEKKLSKYFKTKV